ncbi:MAG: YkgJ family cysteine cluster protein [Candidatus Omnitrophota bacterium]
MFRIRQFVPSKVCLECEVCCRFSEPKGVWLPHTSRKEAAALNRQTIGIRKFKQGFCCEFFIPKENRCRVYGLRPFDCRIYPFLLHKQKGKLFLAAHLACPFIVENLRAKKFQRYVSYLKKFFRRKDIRIFLKENPHLAQDYSEFQKEILPLFSNRCLP